MKNIPSSFPSFSPPSRTTLSWIGYVALVCFSSPCFSCFFISNVVLSFKFVPFLIHFFIFTFLHFIVLGGSIIACRFIQRHIVVLESDIDIFKSILLPMRELEQKHISQQVASQRRSVFAPLPGRWRSTILICCVCKFVLGLYLACNSILSDRIRSNMAHVFFSSSFMRRVQNESLICVLNADMFATPLTAFELPYYVVKLAIIWRKHRLHLLVAHALSTN